MIIRKRIRQNNQTGRYYISDFYDNGKSLVYLYTPTGRGGKRWYTWNEKAKLYLMDPGQE